MPQCCPSAGEIRLAHKRVRQMVVASGSSFLLGMRLLSRPQRQAMYAIYAFAHTVDDIADGSTPKALKLSKLSAWQSEIEQLYAGHPTQPITIALHEPVISYGLEQAEFMNLLEAMAVDASSQIRAPDWKTLQQYCYQVAGTIGLLSIRVFGATGAPARQFALALAEALQLTNILRDLQEDALQGRLYLPSEYLLEYAINPNASPGDILAHANTQQVCAKLARQARKSFARADKALAECDRELLRPALLMMGIYERILDRLEQRGWNPAATRVPWRMSALEKISGAIFQGMLRA